MAEASVAEARPEGEVPRAGGVDPHVSRAAGASGEEAELTATCSITPPSPS